MVVESEKYVYNESNQLVSLEFYYSYTVNVGWSAYWDSDWYDRLPFYYKIYYDAIDIEQMGEPFYALSWKDYLEWIKEEYSAYYECREDGGRINRTIKIKKD